MLHEHFAVFVAPKIELRLAGQFADAIVDRWYKSYFHIVYKISNFGSQSGTIKKHPNEVFECKITADLPIKN